MKNPSTTKLFLLVSMISAIVCAFSARADQRLDGTWVGTENVSLAKRTDCPPPSYQTNMRARIAVAQGGTLLAVVDGYGPGRYTNLRWSGNTLIFEIPNKRKGELQLSADGKTLTEKGSVRRTTTVTSGQRSGAMSGQAPQITGMTACLDEITGTFHREK
jgi:hypothetical protein